jgi:hypothetical protein
VASAEQKLSMPMIARGGADQRTDEHDILFGDGYYAPQNRVMNGRVERVLRWEGEL